MHSDIDSSHKILLSYVFAIKEFMEINHRFTRKIEDGTRWRFSFFAKRNGKIVSCPISVFQHPLETTIVYELNN